MDRVRTQETLISAQVFFRRPPLELGIVEECVNAAGFRHGSPSCPPGTAAPPPRFLSYCQSVPAAVTAPRPSVRLVAWAAMPASLRAWLVLGLLILSDRRARTGSTGPAVWLDDPFQRGPGRIGSAVEGDSPAVSRETPAELVPNHVSGSGSGSGNPFGVTQDLDTSTSRSVTWSISV